MLPRARWTWLFATAVTALATACGTREPSIRRPDDAELPRHDRVRASAVPEVAQLALGRYHACAVLTDGGVRCVGRNEYGQLGDGSTEDRGAPSLVRGVSDAVEVAVGDYHSCARRADRTVVCWGYNATGQLGDGSKLDRRVPWAVTGLDEVEQLALGSHHSCARLTGGAVSCWGYDGDGELGDGAGSDRPTPTRVRGVTSASSLAVGSYSACVVAERGEVFCWGSNMAGQVGDGTTLNRSVATRVVDLHHATSLSVGFAHACARVSDKDERGSVHCWGANFHGQLGDGTRDAQLVPRIVPSATDVSKISLGFAHTCVLRADGTARCFGDVHPPFDREARDVVDVAAAGSTTCLRFGGGGMRCDGWEFFDRLLVP